MHLLLYLWILSYEEIKIHGFGCMFFMLSTFILKQVASKQMQMFVYVHALSAFDKCC